MMAVNRGGRGGSRGDWGEPQRGSSREWRGREPGRDVTAKDPIRRLGGGDRSLRHTGPPPLKQNPHTPGEGDKSGAQLAGGGGRGGTAAPAGWGRPGRGPREARAGCPGAPALYFGGVGDRWVWE